MATKTLKTENLLLEDDEIYETQCGEIFFTSRGRIIFHCTLCEKKFQNYDFYEMHIQEHFMFVEEKDKINIGDENQIDIYQNEPIKSLSLSDESNFNNNLEQDDSMCSNNIENSEKEYYTGNEEFITPENEQIFHINDRNAFEKIVATKIENSYQVRPLVTDSLVPNLLIQENETFDKQRFSLQFMNEIAEYKRKFERNIAAEDFDNNMTVNVEIPKVVRAVRSRFSQRSALTPAEERKYKCPVCGSAFKERHNMIHHLKRHSDNKDHKCPECDKSFFTTSEVNTHLKSHKGERPFLCNACGKSFCYKNQMLTHLKRHTNEKNYKCQICGKAFFDNYLLKNHMVGHSSERPHACTHNGCMATFARKRTLNNHLKLHQNKREYQCTLCSSRFNQKAGVVSHMKSSHKMAKEPPLVREK